MKYFDVIVTALGINDHPELKADRIHATDLKECCEIMATHAQFEKFKASFLLWQSKLGMTDYRAEFENVTLEGRFADINIDHENRICLVRLTTVVDYAADKFRFSPEAHGKHEAIHLFLSRLNSLAHSRYVMRREIDDTEEGMVRTLEKVL